MPSRCKHDLMPGQCAICLGQVNRDNQTREYADPDPEEVFDSAGLSPAVNQTGNLGEAPEPDTVTELDDLEPTPRFTNYQKEKNEMSGKPLCKVPNCAMKVVAQGFCISHYDKWRHGRLEGDWPPFQKVRTASSPQPRKRPAQAPAAALPAILHRGRSFSAPALKTPRAGAGGTLTLDLSDYPDILAGLGEAARKHIRSIPHQAVACIHSYLVQENYITQPRAEN